MVQVIEKNKKKEQCTSARLTCHVHTCHARVGASFLINNNEPHQLRGCSTFYPTRFHVTCLGSSHTDIPWTISENWSCSRRVFVTRAMVSTWTEKLMHQSKSSVSLSSVLDGSGFGLVPTTVFLVGPPL